MMRTLRWAGLVALLVAAGGLTACSLLDPPPQADFSWTPSAPQAGAEIQFTDNSKDQGSPFSSAGVKTWSWNFGDDASSPSQSPRHTYSKGGTYSVTLTVTDASGGTNSVTKQIIVSASVTGRWTGTITSLTYNTFSLTFDLTQLPGGSVTGTITISPALPQRVSSGSFNATTMEIELYSEGYGLIFRGDLDVSQTRMSGYYYNDDTNERGEDWQVSL